MENKGFSQKKKSKKKRERTGGSPEKSNVIEKSKKPAMRSGRDEKLVKGEHFGGESRGRGKKIRGKESKPRQQGKIDIVVSHRGKGKICGTQKFR